MKDKMMEMPMMEGTKREHKDMLNEKKPAMKKAKKKIKSIADLKMAAKEKLGQK
jgi:hypothetical protein